jgi:hypothetical protein
MAFTKISSQTQITGFGKLRIGSPLTLLNDLGYPSDIKVVNNDHSYFGNAYENTTGKNICLIVSDSITGENSAYGYFNPDVRYYYVPRFKVTDNIEISQVELRFYKGKLYSIRCYPSSEFSEALSLKYGKPEMKVDKEDHTFTYTYTGATVVKTDATYTSTWKTNVPNYTCEEVLRKWYSDEGKEYYYHKLTLCDSSNDEEISNKEIAYKKRIDEKKLQEKKKSLDGF